MNLLLSVLVEPKAFGLELVAVPFVASGEKLFAHLVELHSLGLCRKKALKEILGPCHFASSSWDPFVQAVTVLWDQDQFVQSFSDQCQAY